MSEEIIKRIEKQITFLEERLNSLCPDGKSLTDLTEFNRTLYYQYQYARNVLNEMLVK